MTSLPLFLLKSRVPIGLSVLLGLIGGAGSAGIIAMIHAVVTAQDRPSYWSWLFAGAVLAVILARMGAALLVTRLAQRLICDLRIDLSHKILAAPLPYLQSLGAPRLLAALTEDVATLAAAVQALPSLCISGAIVLGCLVYMGVLSWPLLLVVAVTIVLGIAIFLLIKSKALVALRAARQSQDEIFAHFRGLTEGIKELKLNRSRRDAFFSEGLVASATACRDHSIVGEERYILAGNIANGLLFVIIGVIMFGMPAQVLLPSPTVTGFVLALVYLMTPLAGLVDMLPVLSRARVAVDRINALEEILAASSRQSASPPGPLLFPGVLELIGVTYTYRREGDDHPFALGPIDLVLSPGEVVFLIGGNGSGKTTFAMLLVGLYAPESGAIRLGGRIVTEANREQYRQHFATVFSDFYLFDRLLGFRGRDLDIETQKHLAQLQLDHKVRVENGTFSTLRLSQGQRKRLALLVAYLEDRPFYVFDEWAADQDPVFKKIFYTEILPSLKAKGKTVIAITHDDGYFHVADRCFKFEDGKLKELSVSVSKPKTAPRIHAGSEWQKTNMEKAS